MTTFGGGDWCAFRTAEPGALHAAEDEFENASATEPASPLAVHVADDGALPTTIDN